MYALKNVHDGKYVTRVGHSPLSLLGPQPVSWTYTDKLEDATLWPSHDLAAAAVAFQACHGVLAENPYTDIGVLQSFIRSYRVVQVEELTTLQEVDNE